MADLMCKNCAHFEGTKKTLHKGGSLFAHCEYHETYVPDGTYLGCYKPKKDPWDADISAKEASKLMRRKVRFGDVTLFDMPDHEPRADKSQAMKILEESSEVLEAQKRYEQNPTLGNLADLRDEVADVIQATANFIGGLDAMGVADGALDFSDDMKLCEMRNISRGRISKEGE